MFPVAADMIAASQNTFENELSNDENMILLRLLQIPCLCDLTKISFKLPYFISLP